MSGVTRWVVAEVLNGQGITSKPVQRLFQIAEEGLSGLEFDPVDNLLGVSFVENFSDDCNFIAKVRPLFGPNIHEALRQIDEFEP